MRGVQRRRDLLGDGDRARDGHRPRLEQLVDSPALDQPHGDVETSVDLAEIVDRHDMRFVEAGRHLGFASKSPLVGVVVGEVRGQHLQRDDPVHRGVVGLPDLAHAAAAQHLHQAVSAERRPFHGLTIRQVVQPPGHCSMR